MPTLSFLTRCILISATFLGPPRADHLVPDEDKMKDEYGVKLQAVFVEAYKSGVILRALYVSSFVPEYAVGMRPGPKQGELELFLLEPSSSVWQTELIRSYETGKTKSLGPDGKPIPLEKDKVYQEIKTRSPSDHRKIKVAVKTRIMPKALADRLKTVWVARLKKVKPEQELWTRTDGPAYHFAATIDGRQVGGVVGSPEKDMPKMWRLARLVDRMADYTLGSVDVPTLMKALEEAE